MFRFLALSTTILVLSACYFSPETYPEDEGRMILIEEVTQAYEEDPCEFNACTWVQNVVEACFADFCAGPGAGSFLCEECLSRGYRGDFETCGCMEESFDEYFNELCSINDGELERYIGVWQCADMHHTAEGFIHVCE